MQTQEQHFDRCASIGVQPPAVPAAGVGWPALQALVDHALREWHAGVPGLPAVTPASRLESDLGFDSLARTELLLRTERAFVVAACSRVPLVPRGNRGILPAGAWWPRPVLLEVEPCEPVMPSEDNSDAFTTALALRTATQRAIAQRLWARDERP